MFLFIDWVLLRIWNHKKTLTWASLLLQYLFDSSLGLFMSTWQFHNEFVLPSKFHSPHLRLKNALSQIYGMCFMASDEFWWKLSTYFHLLSQISKIISINVDGIVPQYFSGYLFLWNPYLKTDALSSLFSFLLWIQNKIPWKSLWNYSFKIFMEVMLTIWLLSLIDNGCLNLICNHVKRRLGLVNLANVIRSLIQSPLDLC